MSSNSSRLVIPRPGEAATSQEKPVPGPTEEAFTNAFGNLLPPAQFLNTYHGKAAYYEIRPSASAKASRVLLVHGVQTPALGMLPLARALQESFPTAHLVLLDLWGHGLSDTPVTPHEASLFHSLFDVLLDKLQWPSAHLVGFSFGGSLTAGYVATRPERVQSFVLVAPAGLLSSTDLSEEEKGHMRGGDDLAARKWVLEWLEGGELIVPQDWKDRVERGEIVAEAVRAWQIREHPGHMPSVLAIVRDGGVMDNHAAFEEGARRGVPSLAVLGEKDGVCTKSWLNDVGIDNVVVPDVGHAVVRVKASDVAAFIRSFWDSIHF